MNLGQAADRLINKMGFTNTGKERIWCHDVIHVISQQTALDESKPFPYFTDEAEILSTLYQAVLLRENKPELTYGDDAVTEIRDGGRLPSFRTIEKIIDEVMNLPFINRPNYTPVNRGELYEHYITAIRLEVLLESKLGKHLGEMSKDEISQQPVELFENLLNLAKQRDFARNHAPNIASDNGLERI